tara:strand:+ start:34948 stop:35190 length:243 start_codon:yes stop_codon:yes gene_type:complete
MENRKEKMEKIENIINGKKKFDDFALSAEAFHKRIETMSWNDIEKLASSANISVYKKNRGEIRRELFKVYVAQKRKPRTF